MVKLVKSTLRFDVATAAIKGGRDYQEDSLIASFPQGQETGFAVLADGMGGHMSGDIASALVMSEVFTNIKMKEMLLEKQITDISGLLYNTASAANDRIMRYIEDEPESHGMGSTLLATVIRGDELYWVSVGDSPLFLFRDGELRQLNQDHSMAPQIDMMVKVGAMTEEVGRNHPDRNTLTSAIAGIDIDKIDCPDDATTVLPGDIIVVASDGLQFLSNDEIAQILTENKSKRSSKISRALLAAVEELADPDQDNTAFSVIKLGERQVAEKAAPVDTSAVLVNLRSDLQQDHPVVEVAAEEPEQTTVEAEAEETVPNVVEEVAEAPEPIDIPQKRIIRLVTSKALTFDRSEAPVVEEPAPIAQNAQQDLGSWYRRQK